MNYSIIGSGRIVNKHINSAIKNHLYVVGICDLDIVKTRFISSCIGDNDAHITHFIEEIALISDSQIVFISVSTDAHFDIAKKLLKSNHNTNLIIEKLV